VIPTGKNIMNIKKILPKLPALVVVGGIWFLSSQSILPVPKGILGFDKFQHLLAYLVLAGTLSLWFPLEQWAQHWLRTILLTTLVSSVYGVGDEIHQYFVPGRDCNVWDWIADTIGAFLGAFAAYAVMKLWRTRKLNRENNRN
jgi:VanZ family protein